MNYPFKKRTSLSRFVSLSLVTLLMLTMLGGCSLLPAKQTTEPPTEAPSTEESTVPPTTETTAPPTTEATEPPTEAKKENMAVVKEQLNLRTSPSTGSRIITQLDAGEEVEVLRMETVGTVGWAYVASDSLNVMGWIVTDMLDLSQVQLSTGSTSTPANTDATTSTGETTATTPDNTQTGSSEVTPGNSKMAVVIANDLNIRSSASQSGDRVGSYSYGDRIAILETSNGWGRTNKGWVSLSYVYIDGDTSPEAVYGNVTATTLNVRSGPGTTYDRVKSLNMHDRVQILKQIKIGNTTWGYTSGGWVSMEFISVEGTGSGVINNNTNGGGMIGGSGTGTVTGNAVNVREGAGTNYRVVGSLNYGDIVTISETTTAGGYTWGHVTNGWVCMDYVRMN